MVWASFLLAIAATGLALMSLLYTRWQRPSIRIDFTTNSKDGSKALTCAVLNAPVNRALRWLGVSRSPAVDVITGFEISEYGSGRVVIPNLAETLAAQPAEVHVPRITIASSRFSSGFPIALLTADDMTVNVFDANQVGHVLPTGKYTCRVRLVWDMETVEGHRDFVVGSTADAFSWQ